MGESASTLISLACQICNVPGRVIQVGKFLNIILADYAQTMDLDTIRLIATLNIGPQATTPYFYALPSNYLRAAEKPYYNVNGAVFACEQFSLEELNDSYTASGIANYPEWFATDMSTTPQVTAGAAPSMAFYPPPAVPLVVTVPYRPQTADIVNPESSTTVPWFPNQRVLLTDLCVMAGMIADDARAVGNWQGEVEKRMRKYLEMDDDKEGYSQTVKLDARYFRSGVKLPPSKTLGF